MAFKTHQGVPGEVKPLVEPACKVVTVHILDTLQSVIDLLLEVPGLKSRHVLLCKKRLSWEESNSTDLGCTVIEAALYLTFVGIRGCGLSAMWVLLLARSCMRKLVTCLKAANKHRWCLGPCSHGHVRGKSQDTASCIRDLVHITCVLMQNHRPELQPPMPFPNTGDFDNIVLLAMLCHANMRIKIVWSKNSR